MPKAKNEDEIREIIESFGYELLDCYIDKGLRVVFTTKDGFKANTLLSNLITNNGGFYIVNKKNPYSLENISLWLILNNKDFELCEDNVYEGNNKKLKFYCFICNEIFYMPWGDLLSRKCGCNICSGRSVGEHSNLQYVNPILSKEWLKSKNNFGPNEVTEFSSEEVYWECSDCDYRWWAKVSARSAGKGCSACAGFIVSDKNRLSINFLDIASEWHPIKNGKLTPNDVSYGSGKKVWWKCHVCDYEWETTVQARKRGRSCPRCAQEQYESKIATECKQYFYNNYNAQIEYKVLRNINTGRWLPFDIYIPDRVYVEIHGPQHYKAGMLNVKESEKKNISVQEEFEYRQSLDKLKKEFAEENGFYIEVDLRKIKTAEQAIKYIKNMLFELDK